MQGSVPSPAVTGEIRSTRRLEVAHVHLLIRAYNALHPTDHATATLNVTVQWMDQRAPSCVPAISVYGSGWGVGQEGCSAMLRTRGTEADHQLTTIGPRNPRQCPLAAPW